MFQNVRPTKTAGAMTSLQWFLCPKWWGEKLSWGYCAHCRGVPTGSYDGLGWENEIPKFSEILACFSGF